MGSGLEAEYFLLANSNQNFDIASTGNPIVARPYFNVQTGLEASQLLAYPGALFHDVWSQTPPVAFRVRAST